MQRFQIFGFALAAGIVLGQGASAATIPQTLTQWGLVGTWAPDCNRPADIQGNVYLTFAIDGDRMTMHRSYGSGTDDSPILFAEIRDDGALVLQLDIAGGFGTYEDVLIKDKDMRERAMATRSVATGRYTIKDGVVVSTDKPSVWLNHCIGI
jgi:hypothetical protein